MMELANKDFKTAMTKSNELKKNMNTIVKVMNSLGTWYSGNATV